MINKEHPSNPHPPKQLCHARILFGILIAGYILVALSGCQQQVLDTPQERNTASNLGSELVGEVVFLHEYDKDLLREKIAEGKAYLLRMIDPEFNGAHKYYYALEDEFEDRLHTIYTSSLIYTLFKLYDLEPVEELWEQIEKSMEYVLSMKLLDEESDRYGAFHYSFSLDTEERERKFVVGTTSKTIFTLLEMYRRTEDERYLEAAKKAADWLLTMQKDDGSMKSYVVDRDGKWFFSTKESTLYNGQVLSALSRMYRVTEGARYLEVAEDIADFLRAKVEKDGCYIGDDYRPDNPISSSWFVMSMVDYYLATHDEGVRDIVFTCAIDLVGRQHVNESDLSTHGRWKGSLSTSGAGWISEILLEVYHLCLEEEGEDCEQYKDAIVKGMRWLLQNTYGDHNSGFLPNPAMAKGGLYWNPANRFVRTDAVCHGMNAYVGILNDLPEETLLSIPETNK
ncbi:glycoside hydrolase family 127 protein [Patescibacteria group bacterium]|nr:glycoside hydrolase family 127 protein [Patescibacteria group bacterium]